MKTAWNCNKDVAMKLTTFAVCHSKKDLTTNRTFFKTFI